MSERSAIVKCANRSEGLMSLPGAIPCDCESCGAELVMSQTTLDRIRKDGNSDRVVETYCCDCWFDLVEKTQAPVYLTENQIEEIIQGMAERDRR